MQSNFLPQAVLAIALCAAAAAPASAQSEPSRYGGKLLLTGGVSQIEGAGGGGLTPWALIGGYGTRDQIGASAFYTRVGLSDYSLDSYGALVGLYDRVELSIARQRFDTRDVGAALGLGRGFTFTQDTVGVKVKVAGDAVYEQDSWLPQIAVGAMHKRNDQPDVLAFVGAQRRDDIDFYVSATKIYLNSSLLVNGTLRYTRANQFGILGFGGDLSDSRSIEIEGSVARLLSPNLALGAEFRSKPDKLGIAREDNAWDVFLAWAPNKHASLTLAYVDLGNIVIEDDQRGWYLSLQLGF